MNPQGQSFALSVGVRLVPPLRSLLFRIWGRILKSSSPPVAEEARHCQCCPIGRLNGFTQLKLVASRVGSFQVVADACQLRSDKEWIMEFASRGFITLVTGSKFISGPPFCGAVLFPGSILEELDAGTEHLPRGFGDYFTRHEVKEIEEGSSTGTGPTSAVSLYSSVLIGLSECVTLKEEHFKH